MPDREATFAEFVRVRWPRLVRLAYSLTLDVGRAEDLVQESLAKLWPVWPRIRDGYPEAYVRRTIVNGAISASRRRWRAEEPHWDLPDLPTAAASEGVDTRDLVRRELARLSVLQRAVVVLRYAEDLTEQQVADLLGISPGTVKTHASRGLSRLRQTVPPALFGPDGGGHPQPAAPMRPIAGPVPRPVTGPVPRPVAGPLPRPVARPVPRPVTGPGAGPVAGPLPRPVAGPGAGPGAAPGSGPGSRPGVGPGSGPGTGPGSGPGAGPGSGRGEGSRDAPGRAHP